MAKTKKEFSGPSQIAMLLGKSPSEMGAGGQNSVKKIPRDKLMFLDCNDEVYNPNDKRIETTAHDILQRGIQQPLLVFSKGNGMYCVISGNRRLAATDFAVRELGYTEGEYIPCIEVDAPESPQDLRMDMIKDNLQRDKTSYERMREAVVYYQQLVEKYKDQGRQNLRDILYKDLGVSASEVTRYFKINESLLPEVLDYFKMELLSTDVAFSLAKESEGAQRFVYENWPQENDAPARLTKPVLIDLLNKALLPTVSSYITPPAAERKTPKREKPEVVFENVEDGVRQLGAVCTTMHETIKTSTRKDIDKKNEKRLLTKLTKEMEKIAAIQAEIISLYGPAEESEA